jgi:hypothetical protein
MEDLEICPPWWPNIVWWLTHRPPHHGPIPHQERLVEVTETLLTALHSFHYGHVYAVGPKHDETLRAQIQKQALQQMTEAVQQLSALSHT